MKEYTLNDEEKKFVESIKKGYHNRSFIKKLVNYRYFDNNSEFDKEKDEKNSFVQIVDGILMNPSDFSGDIDNTYLGGQIGESLAFGEINYLIKRIKENFRFDYIHKNILTPECLLTELEKLPPEFKPKYLLIPIDEYTTFYDQFNKENVKIIHEKGDTKLIIGNYSLEVFWSNRFMDFKEAYLLGKNAIEWIIKKNHQMKEIRSEIFYSHYKDSDFEIDIFYGKMPDNKINYSVRTVVFASIHKEKIRIYKVK